MDRDRAMVSLVFVFLATTSALISCCGDLLWFAILSASIRWGMIRCEANCGRLLQVWAEEKDLHLLDHRPKGSAIFRLIFGRGGSFVVTVWDAQRRTRHALVRVRARTRLFRSPGYELDHCEWASERDSLTGPAGAGPSPPSSRDDRLGDRWLDSSS